jgi:hypothetical protein
VAGSLEEKLRLVIDHKKFIWYYVPTDDKIASMIFRAVLEDFQADDKEAIRVRFATIALSSGIGRQVESNMQLECKLPHDCAKSMILGLLAEANDIEQLRETFQRLCESNLLKGPEILGIRPKVLGRAMVLDSFCANLVRFRGFRTSKQAEAWLKRQCKLDSANAAKTLSQIPIGGAVVWATFREPERENDPFMPLPEHPQSLHDELALDPKSRGRPLLLFVYSPPEWLKLRFPTVADARWGRLFRPALNDAQCECGFTAPPTDEESVKPRPELVHERINGNFLTEVLRIIR